MEADAMDPLNTASYADLLAMTQGPLEGNLCEQIIAAKRRTNCLAIAMKTEKSCLNVLRRAILVP